MSLDARRALESRLAAADALAAAARFLLSQLARKDAGSASCAAGVAHVRTALGIFDDAPAAPVLVDELIDTACRDAIARADRVEEHLRVQNQRFSASVTSGISKGAAAWRATLEDALRDNTALLLVLADPAKARP